MSTTIFFSGLHHAACLLACPPASYAHCWVCTWSALLACWLGFGQVGLEPSVLTHWVTATNFLGLRLIPRSRAYLGAITTKSVGVCHFLAQICPRHVVSFISVLAQKSAHKVFCRARAPRGHATRSSCTVRAGKSMVSRYRRSRCVPRSISWPGTKVASTRRISPSKGKSTR